MNEVEIIKINWRLTQPRSCVQPPRPPPLIRPHHTSGFAETHTLLIQRTQIFETVKRSSSLFKHFEETPTRLRIDTADSFFFFTYTYKTRLLCIKQGEELERGRDRPQIDMLGINGSGDSRWTAMGR